MADTKLSALTELAATPANNDEVYIRDVSEIAADESKRITIANLLAGAGAPTKEFWVFPGAVSGGTITSKGFFAVHRLITTGNKSSFSFKIPHDYSSITNAEVIVIPAVTEGSANWDTRSNYGSAGQAYNTHAENDFGSTYNVTLNQLFVVNIAGVITNIVAGDYVGIMIELQDSAHDFDVIGLRFRYS